MTFDGFGWKFTCEWCGDEFRSRGNNAKLCENCRKMKRTKLGSNWIHATMCICCGELNPLFLLTGDGHHILGKDNSEITIPICANCHECTKPREQQGFLLFNHREFPLKTKFTEDNSKIYIDID